MQGAPSNHTRRPRPIALAALVFLGGCVTALVETGDPAACDARLMEPGEVRARRVPCSDELMAGGEARRGDLLLENAHLRAFFSVDHALSMLGGAGGTLVDLAPPEERDGLIEGVPLIAGEWFETAKTTLVQEPTWAGLVVEGILPDGQPHTVTWRLRADASELELEGADALRFVPAADSGRVGDTVVARSALSGGVALMYATDAEVQDFGGWLEWEGATRLYAGDRPTVLAARWTDLQTVSGTTDGSAVYAWGDGSLVTRVPVIEGAFDAEIPAVVDTLTARRSGHESSDAVAPGLDLDLPLGAPGFLSVHAEDPDGRPLPVTVRWNGGVWRTGTDSAPIGVGPGTGQLQVSAGPGWSIADAGEITVADHTAVAVVLEPAHQHAALADLFVVTSPDAGTRRGPARQLEAAAARGVRYAVTVAGDEVSDDRRYTDTARWLTVRAGSRANTDDFGTPQAWPWSSSSRLPAHGAAPWSGLEPDTLLATMDGGVGRFTMVDARWLEAAGPPWSWSPSPGFVRLDSLDDLSAIQAALDLGAGFALVGPSTWLNGLDPLGVERVASERALIEGRTVASNGPWVDLDVLGHGPGDRVNAPWLPVHVECSGPDWMPIAGASLIGEGGVELARWEATSDTAPQVEGDVWIEGQTWLVATCWGDEAAAPDLDAPAWAVTSPLWGLTP